MTESVAEEFLQNSVRQFRQVKAWADKALAQITEEEFFATADAESNSIAVLVKHMAGNLRSRWTDFRTADGEKPDRNRDSEFVILAADTREALMTRWNFGWDRLFDALAELTPDDLLSTVLIRHEPHTVIKAIQRQLVHQAYHAGQIVQWAKARRGEAWQTLSIPRNQSRAFNAAMVHAHAAVPQGDETD